MSRRDAWHGKHSWDELIFECRETDKRAKGAGAYGTLHVRCAEALAALAAENQRLREARDPEKIAQAFHEAYERLAPSFGYETREASAVPWADVPEPNRSLMIAVAAEVLAALAHSQEQG